MTSSNPSVRCFKLADNASRVPRNAFTVIAVLAMIKLTMLSAAATAYVRDLEVKDLSTAAHTWRVVLYARALAEDAGVAPAMLDRITYGAAVHDIGKLNTPDHILQKPGPLTPAEFEIIKRHPQDGYQLLSQSGESDQVVLDMVHYHHERVDGLGYPDGLKGEAIPRAARYFSVVDTFDALTSIRPYRKQIGHGAAEQAITELRAGMGTRYCNDAVERFSRLFLSGQIEWILNHFNDSCPVPEIAALTNASIISPGRYPRRLG
jgi:putative nucleotidyltransferase with HDIG domain